MTEFILTCNKAMALRASEAQRLRYPFYYQPAGGTPYRVVQVRPVKAKRRVGEKRFEIAVELWT